MNDDNFFKKIVLVKKIHLYYINPWGAQNFFNKCLSATECSQLSQNTCEKTTDALKERCEWNTTNNIC